MGGRMSSSVAEVSQETAGTAPAHLWQRPWFFPAILAVLTLAVFARVAECGFTNYDDPIYVTHNPDITAGLSTTGIWWALTGKVGGLWHPATLLSLLVDYQLFGFNATGYHIHNLLLHLANVVLLFVCLKRMTHDLWRSALIAALFAVHPLRVESVAWIVERKDVSSTFFMLLAMLAYTRQILTPSWKWLTLMALALGLSLLAKPMYVTLPFLLLLLDVWPLRRIAVGTTGPKKLPPGALKPWTPRYLLLEKLPLVLVIALAAGPTMYEFARGVSGKALATPAHASITQGLIIPKDVATEDPGPLGNLANSMVAYVRYIGKLFYFADLAPLYPLENWSAAAVTGAVALLLAVTAVCVGLWWKSPWVLIGWLWYLLVLLPVNNVQKFAFFSMADRYTYFPSVGILIALVFSIPNAAFVRPDGKRLWGAVIAGVLAVLSFCTVLQIGYWKDSDRLFGHTVEVTKDNYIARLNYGDALQAKGQLEAAAAQFQEALRIKPNMYLAHAHLGQLYASVHMDKEAVDEFYKAAVLNTLVSDLFYEMVPSLLRLKRYPEALAMGRHALDMGLNTAEIHHAVGEAYLEMADYAQAEMELRKALAISPASASIRADLDRCLAAARGATTATRP